MGPAGPLNNRTLGTQRDKASAAYRYTPDSQWDFKVDYSHERRSGTQPVGLNTGFGTSFLEAPLPIDDRTQNVSASARHVGTTPWNTKWITNLQYFGSFYDNDLQTLNVLGSPLAGRDLRLALPPSNWAQAFTFNNMVDLPGKSRLANTVQYNMMRQNDPFVSTSTNGFVPMPFPASSLDGKVNTLLINNVLTTQITPDLRSTLRYRYYDYDNDTPELFWDDYVRFDNSVANLDRTNLAMGYRKHNAGADLNWRANSWLRLGAVYGWERYDRTRRDVNVTDEHSGKIYADANLGEATARGSVLYAQRRYDLYDLDALVRVPAGGDSENLARMRKYDIANRNRLKIDGFLDIPLAPALTITPTAGLRNDDYPTDVVNQLGLSKDHGWNAGVDIVARLSPTLHTMVGYHYDDRTRFMADARATGNAWTGRIDQEYHSLIASVVWQAIPDRLKFRFDYIYSTSSDATPCLTSTGAGADACPAPDFPTNRSTFQRFDAMAAYTVDPVVVRQMGWVGDVVLKLRYTFQENKGSNWAFDNLTPGLVQPYYLAAFNSNYRAQLIAMSLAARW
jgi:MtrB/PioB family decaheme-associated outer membrane protein